MTRFTMRLLRRFHRSLFRRQFENDMAGEMRDHIERETARRIAAGEDPATARRRAIAEFGSVDARTEEVRERRLGAWLDQTWQDVRYAARQLRQAPGFTFVAITILAVGIAANTSIFSALDSALLRPLPYHEPDRIVKIGETRDNGRLNGVSGGAFQDWRDNPNQTEAIVLVNPVTGNLNAASTLERIDGLEVTHGFLDVLGVTPLRGRGFTPADEQVGGDNRVVLLTEEFWRSRFGADESLPGQTIMLDDEPHTVIGVVPASTWFYRAPKYFIPAVLDPEDSGRSSRSSHWANVFARMQPGVTAAQLDAELKALKESLNPQYPGYKQGWSVRVLPVQSVLSENPRPVLVLLVGAVSVVLLIACANVANLLLARTSRRRREISLRAALGASSIRLIRQTLTESLLLAGIGGALGILLSWWGIKAVGALSSNLLPQVMAPELNIRVLAISVLLTGLTGVLFGLLPAWHSRRPDLNEALKSDGPGASIFRRGRSQSVLVVTEVALTLLLLAGAGLLLRSLERATRSDPGIRVENVLTFDLSPSESRYPSRESRLAYIDRVLTEVESVPGIESVGITVESPFVGGAWGEYISRPDLPPSDDRPIARVNFQAGDYFEAMGMHLRRGRTQTSDEFQADPPRVIVVNETLARQFFGDEDPVGKLLRVSGSIETAEIVGVVADIRPQRLDRPVEPYIYASLAFEPWRTAVVVRTRGLEPHSLVPAVRAALDRIDPGIPMANTRSLTQAVAESLAERRLVLGLVGGFAVTALALACIGLYGVMSYSIAGRHRELAIRLALGASRRSITGMVLADAGRLTLLGLAIGLAGSFASSQLIASQLFEVPTHDPLVLATAVMLLATVSFLACWVPAHRAAGANPITALRND